MFSATVAIAIDAFFLAVFRTQHDAVADRLAGAAHLDRLAVEHQLVPLFS
jgi:hypothetical protein